MSQQVTLKLTNVTLTQTSDTVQVTRTVPEVVIAGVSGPAGPTWAGKYGSFYASATQTPAQVDVAQAVTFNGTYSASGISMVDSSKVTLPTVGTYTMTVVLQLSNLSNSTETARFWLRLNNNDYPNSTTTCAVPKEKSQGVPHDSLVTLTFVGTSTTTNDYVQIFWESTSTLLTLKAEAISTSPPYPASPSAILGITQVA
jgi:hypothetical protein